MVAAIGTFVVIAWLLVVVLRGGGENDRVTEERAREFYDRHGRWPDEDEDLAS
jgi:hypothetical protein